MEDADWLKSTAPATAPASPARVGGRRSWSSRDYKVEVSGKLLDVKVIGEALAGGAVAAPAAAASRPSASARAAAARRPRARRCPRRCRAPSLKVAVSEGQEVAEGDLVCVIEAMKMENEITAHRAGKVTALNVSEGAAVGSGETIAVIGSRGLLSSTSARLGAGGEGACLRRYLQKQPAIGVGFGPGLFLPGFAPPGAGGSFAMPRRLPRLPIVSGRFCRLAGTSAGTTSRLADAEQYRRLAHRHRYWCGSRPLAWLRYPGRRQEIPAPACPRPAAPSLAAPTVSAAPLPPGSPALLTGLLPAYPYVSPVSSISGSTLMNWPGCAGSSTTAR